MEYEVTANGESTLVSADGSDLLNHTITGLDYNTDYDVSVTALNSCGLDSVPATVVVNIEARGKRILNSALSKFMSQCIV